MAMPQVVIDYAKLSALLEDFYRLTNMRITFWDAVGQRCLLGCSNSCSEYCRALQKVPALMKECNRCEEEALTYSSTHQDHLHSFHCHAGMNEFVYPVVYDHSLLGYFMFGQVRIIDMPDDEAAREKLYTAHHLDPEAMTQLYRQFPVVASQLMESAGRMLGALATYAHLNGLMKLRNALLFDRLREYVKENYTAPLPVKEVCRKFHISRSTLSHTLLKEQSTTFVDMVNAYRIEHVKRRLKAGDNIADAAYQAGFNSENYMARLFKKTQGMTPSRYRAENSLK